MNGIFTEWYMNATLKQTGLQTHWHVHNSLKNHCKGLNVKSEGKIGIFSEKHSRILFLSFYDIPYLPQGFICFRIKYAYFLFTDEHWKLLTVPLNLISPVKLNYKSI